AAGPPPIAVAATPDKTALLTVQPGDHVLGDPKAPITMIEYASFTCPHGAHFHTPILPEIKKKWIDTGKVKLISRDFPLDQVAAKAAQIA
ncbi:thioredoxin domain-containing protein, partial [Acinetobacter baumannii]